MSGPTITRYRSRSIELSAVKKRRFESSLARPLLPLSAARACESERAGEPGLFIPEHPKPYGHIRRCQRDAFLSQRKASWETPACELHRSERGLAARTRFLAH